MCFSFNKIDTEKYMDLNDLVEGEAYIAQNMNYYHIIISGLYFNLIGSAPVDKSCISLQWFYFTEKFKL